MFACLSCVTFDTFLDIDLKTGTKAIAYSGLLGSWFVLIFGLATIQLYEQYLNTLFIALAIYGVVLDLLYAISCVLALKAVREQSEHKLIPWLVIGFVTAVSVIAAGFTLVTFLVDLYNFYAAACLLLSFLITWMSIYVWLAVFSLYRDYKFLRSMMKNLPPPTDVDIENQPIEAIEPASEATEEIAPKPSFNPNAPVMLDYNRMRFDNNLAKAEFGESSGVQPFREMLI